MATYKGFVNFHLLLQGEVKEFLGHLENLFLQTEGDVMVHNLKEALIGACLSDLGCAVLHPLLVPRQVVREVNHRRNLVGRHLELV